MLRKFTAFVPRYRKFESISLQQRVRCELDLVAGQHNAMIAAPYLGGWRRDRPAISASFSRSGW